MSLLYRIRFLKLHVVGCKRVVFVLRTADIREILSLDKGADAHFSVTDQGKRIHSVITGDFILGMDQLDEKARAPRPSTYKEQRERLECAFIGNSPADLQKTARKLGEIARKATGESIRRAVGDNAREIDVVTGLANEVPVRLIKEYYGIVDFKEFYGTCWDPKQSLLAHAQNIIFYVINPFAELPLFRGWGRRAAVESGKELHRLIDDQIKARWKELVNGEPEKGTVLDNLIVHLCRSGSPDERDEVRRILTGMIIGTLAPTIGLFISAIDRIMDLPAAEKADVQFAALAALRDEGDETLWTYLREAGRFGAVPSLLVRRCLKPFTVASGSKRATHLKPGDFVVLLPIMAGRDPFTFQNPDDFDTERPGGSYTLFGYGSHMCLAEFLGKILMVEMAAQLLQLRGLERHPVTGRRVNHLGAPKSLVLTFLPARQA